MKDLKDWLKGIGNLLRPQQEPARTMTGTELSLIGSGLKSDCSSIACMYILKLIAAGHLRRPQEMQRQYTQPRSRGSIIVNFGIEEAAFELTGEDGPALAQDYLRQIRYSEMNKETSDGLKNACLAAVALVHNDTPVTEFVEHMSVSIQETGQDVRIRGRLPHSLINSLTLTPVYGYASPFTVTVNNFNVETYRQRLEPFQKEGLTLMALQMAITYRYAREQRHASIPMILRYDGQQFRIMPAEHFFAEYGELG